MGAVESSPRRNRRADRRSALLGALRAAGRPLLVEELAGAAGIAASTAQFHLSLLMSSGLVERTPERRRAAGRPSWRYAAIAPAPNPAAGAPDPYRQLAGALAAQLDASEGAAAAAREAGRRWGESVPAPRLGPDASPDEAIGAFSEALVGLGFEPEPHPEAREVVLRACPFEAVAREHRAVVCGIHLGLAERTAAAIGGGLSVEGLEPFRSDHPLACAIRLGTTP